ncbi:MAG: hypothetical protein ABSB70_02790 [Candidatus Velthaea sp.]|jgi:hypothetical protein
MDTDAQAALSVAYQWIRQTANSSRANRANIWRADDFIARAGEFNARVHLSTAPKRIGADCILLWFSAKAAGASAVISLAGAIDADIAAIGAEIAVYNARRKSPAPRTRPSC